MNLLTSCAAVMVALLLSVPVIATGSTPVERGQGRESGTIVAAGDIANCTDKSQFRRARATSAQVARVLRREPGAVVATLGDNVYRAVDRDDYRRCFLRTWGRFRSDIRPAAGNHDYSDSRASGYFSVFGSAAGARDEGYYAYWHAGWRVLVLNTNDQRCKHVACDEDSRQLAWLRSELDTHGASSCMLAYWHHPRFSSGDHGDAGYVDDLWRTLADGGVDVALTAHDHHYERFAPMDADGKADPAGMRSFIVGTGGADYYGIKRVSPNSEVRRTHVSGVLRLSLHPGEYAWRFEAVGRGSNGDFSDEGKGSCH
jgi:hypothetical protein